MLPELVHQKFCKKNEMITDACTGEIAYGSVSSDIAGSCRHFPNVYDFFLNFLNYNSKND